MAPNPRRVDARLEALYARLPKIDCQRLCADSCGPISMSLRERERMERLAGHQIGCEGITCNMLKDGLCTVHPVRPMLCRLWGLVESMPCHYGCVPEGGLLPDEVGAGLIVTAIEIGGPITHSDAELVAAIEEAKALAGDEEFARVLKTIFRQVAQKPSLAGRSMRSLIERGGAARDRQRT